MKKRIKTKSREANQELANTQNYQILQHHDLRHRLLSFLIDTCVMLAPIMIWDIIMMAVLGSIVSISGIVIVNIIIGVLLLCSILGMNAYIYAQTGGQSLGMRHFGFKVVSKSGEDASRKKLILREVIGFDLPFILLMFFLNIFGVVLYWGINGIVMLIDKRQRTLPDLILQTMVVGVSEPQPMKKRVLPMKPQAPQPTALKSRVDLHIHSNFSANGEYNVEEIFQLAAKRNMKTISITDLDCAKSNSIAKRMGELYHVNYVPGIEINCDLKGMRVRVLGYFIQYNSELYATIENESLVHEKNASIERVRRFERVIGQHIDIDRLLENNRFQKIPGELIARHVLNRSEYQDCPVLQPYITGSKKEDAVRQLTRDYFAHGKECYVSVKYPLLEDVLDVISLSGGVSILAYPGKLLEVHPELVNKAVKLGVQGIEVFHPSHTKKQMSALMKYAMDHQLFITGGSGFYRENSRIQIGEYNCPKDAEAIINDFIEVHS